MKRIFFFLLFLAGCGRGCSLGDEVTVLFRVPASLDQRAPVVINGGQAIGYISQISTGEPPVRVTIAIQKASLLHVGARFVATTVDGKRGLNVIPGQGEPLTNGAVVEADPSYSARAYYANLGRGMPGGITLPSGAHIPFPEALTRPEKDREQERRARLQKSFGRTLQTDPRRHGRLDGGILSAYAGLESKISNAEPAAALAILQHDGAAVRQQLEELEQRYIRTNNREQAAAARSLVKNIEKLEKRLARHVEREKRHGGKPPRERWVPPEFR